MELSSLFLAGKGSALTSFFSTAFLVVFLPFCLVVYSLMPRRGKKYFLLAADCAFFWLISGKLLVYLLLTALSMHYFGLWLDKIQSETKLLLAQTEKAERKTVRKRQQAVQHRILLLAVILHIGVLFALKYSGFAATNVNTLLAHLHIPVQLAIPKYVMPIGISFFTLQALSYIVDVQRGVTKADTNLLRLTLFISFFPQIVEGPICRYDQTAQQLWDAKPITYENLTLGLQRIAYGMMKKIIIADRLNPLVRNVFNNYTDFDGGVIALAAVCYTVQLYMDFSGSMDAVTGTAQILGVTMPENFRQPFFSKTISEFWKRWHITLGTWFKDYVFYPVVTLKPLEKLTSAARKRLGNHYGPLRRALLRVVLQRSLARCRVELSLFRHVPLRVDPRRQHHRPAGAGRQRAAAHPRRELPVPSAADAAHDGAGHHRRAVFPCKRPACRYADVPHHGHRICIPRL